MSDRGGVIGWFGRRWNQLFFEGGDARDLGVVRALFAGRARGRRSPSTRRDAAFARA